MPTELDVALNNVMDHLLDQGGPFEVGTIERFGRELPIFKNAPPSLPHYFGYFCMGEHKDKTFLVDGDIRLTFGETYMAARAVAAGLIATHGVKKGDRVGIAARNSANWIIAYMGALMAGGCATLLNGWWSGDELNDGITLAGCGLLLADEGRAKRLDGFDHGAKIVLFDHDCDWKSGLANLMTDAGDPANLPETGPDDLATILYTSGSTGQSKGAYSDHRGVVQGTMSYVAQSAMALGYLTAKGEAPTLQPCALVAVPLFHVTGEVPLFLQSFALGRKLVLIPKWDPEAAMKAMEAEQVTYFVGVPLMSYEIATHPEREKYDLAACTSFAAGGAPRPVEHVTRIKEAFPEGFPLLGYGLTETNGVGCGNFNENYLAKPGSTGTPSRPLVDIGILDDDGNCLPQGEVGEVSIRTICNFLGYWDNEEATKSAIMEDGYFRTGDLGYLDEENYLYIVDRKKDIIIRGGENISCLEVEQAIYAHPDISECSVFGIPEERLGEVPAAVWLPVEGSNLTAEELAEFVGGQIAKFKVPAIMWKADGPLPRLGTAKIDRKALREQHTAALEAG